MNCSRRKRCNRSSSPLRKSCAAVGSESHLWNWLARVARQHLVKSWRRQKKIRSWLALPNCQIAPDGTAPDSALEESLDAAMRAMDLEDRRLIEQFYFDRLSHKEIAEPLGLTPKRRIQPAGARAR